MTHIFFSLKKYLIWNWKPSQLEIYNFEFVLFFSSIKSYEKILFFCINYSILADRNSFQWHHRELFFFFVLFLFAFFHFNSSKYIKKHSLTKKSKQYDELHLKSQTDESYRCETRPSHFDDEIFVEFEFFFSSST